MVVCIMSSRYLYLTFMCLGGKNCSLGVYCVLFSICCGCVCLLCLECYVNHLVMSKAFGFSTSLFLMCWRFVARQLCCFVICLSCAFKILQVLWLYLLLCGSCDCHLIVTYSMAMCVLGINGSHVCLLCASMSHRSLFCLLCGHLCQNIVCQLLVYVLHGSSMMWI
jgi:hypothetical protein